MIRRLVILFAILTGASAAAEPFSPAFAALAGEFNRAILPLIDKHCLECHDAIASEGELDLERFADLAAVRTDPKTWQHVVYQLETGEMPPTEKDRVPPTVEERAALIDWARRFLDAEARAQAGDPGPVVLRRLSNAEYTYTIRDLTGIPSLDPAREFPVDSASGEGFTNAGGALVMSPALFEKYLEAGKEIAQHAVLLPDGFRFSASTTRADHANEILEQIRALYLDTTGGSDINFSYSAEVRPAAPEGEGEGRLNLEPYFAALLAHREQLRADPSLADAIAGEAGLNARYFAALAMMLVRGEPRNSFLLDRLRGRWRTAGPDDAAELAAEVRRWQDRLWTFNKVGHLGLVQPWQQAVNPTEAARDLRIKLDREATSLFLTAHSIDGAAASVRWERPRLERPGRPPILLRDLQRGIERFESLRRETLAATADYLAAAAALRDDPEHTTIATLAEAKKLDPQILQTWASYLGLDHDGPAEIRGYLTAPVRNGGGYDFVKGWTLPDVPDYSLVSNSSDQDVRIPGELNAHRITVHPRPERWIAAGWRSPLDGRLQIAPRVRDAHNACGNGVSWALELRRGTRIRVLASGDVDNGQTAAIEPLDSLEVRQGDLVSLIIGARDGSHVCDLTEIDLGVQELDGVKRSWSLAGDCADTIDAGNPHPDRHGNPAVWHFHGGLNDERALTPGVVPGSLLAQWLDQRDPHRTGDLANRLQTFLTAALPAEATGADRETHRHLTSLGGPLFVHLDFAELAHAGDDPAVPAPFTADGDIIARTPLQLEFPLPAAVLADAEFVARAVVEDSGSPTSAVQITANVQRPDSNDLPIASEPFLVAPEGRARTRLEGAFDDFRNLFPAAMCYARIVPADEVVTLLLYHREDGHLARLMLDDAGKERLDRLWEQLTFVSREPLRLVTAYEQLWQFATQDADPKKFEPMEDTIRSRAAEFESKLRTAEPRHLDALLSFAPKLYRRPLEDVEADKLRELYDRLRSEGLSHEDSFQLTLARLFSSAAFLYKSEEPAAGEKQGPVSGWELATRLSYFLTSSAPDDALRAAATAGTLTTDDVLLAHTRRLLADARARRLAIHFACQWLHIRDFDQHDEKNERLYPEFAELRGSMNEEAIRFFTDFFRNDRSILSLLDAGHTFVDAPLAAFYGLDAPTDEWQRVDNVQSVGRGGILALATTLAKQSGASRTSPILRGNWVSETLLGEKLPRPPRDVPQLPDTVPAGFTERELIARHSADPACAKCHDRIDPFGFALEGYDAIGRFRSGADTRATLPDGTAIDGLDGLRRYLRDDRRDTFVRHFCQKLLGYALGRAVQLSDEPLLDEIMAKLETDDYRVSLAIEAIVLSTQFREIRGVQQP